MSNAIDLYSGIGGWTLGMKLSGIGNVASYEWWPEANQTHNLNFETHHKEVDIRQIDPKRDLNFDKKIDFVVGSPPCTQFSYANRGGNGDISDGLIDIYKFLEVVEHLQPKYWAMENVPRVAKILEEEIKNGALKRFENLVKHIIIVDTADYGTPQNRKRMIAGNFPLALFYGYKTKILPVTLGNVLNSLNENIIVDPNYGYKIERKKITELENEADLTPQELRINKDAKTYHPIYNNMSFPDRLDRPSRTVTATCTRVSRESIIIKSENGYRRLNVRERGVIQGFPITYQFYGKTVNAKFKMIGNAVPPVLTYYIFQSMLETPITKVRSLKESSYLHEQPKFKAYKSKIGLPIAKYPSTRKFQFAVPNLRFGSGVRFELSNNLNIEKNLWSFKFFYGNSKKIKELKLNGELIEKLPQILNITDYKLLEDEVKVISKKYTDINSKVLQEKWTKSTPNMEAFIFLDDVGLSISRILQNSKLDSISSIVVKDLINDDSKKLIDKKNEILVGLFFLSILNTKIIS
jgi:DNA (cytosine-5)-methyltransferase 1